MNIDRHIISPDDTLLNAMRVIDSGSCGAAMVCGPDRNFLGVVTDGDIRRALIAGDALGSPVSRLLHKHNAICSPWTTRAEAIRIMLRERIDVLPVIGDDGRLENLHTLNDSLRLNTSPSWAVIMAGGKGERMGDLTKGIPKPMLHVGTKPIIVHIVRLLVAHGITRIFVSVGYLGRMIEDCLGDGSEHNCQIEYLREDPDKSLGTGGALSLLPEAPTAPLVVMNGDLLTHVNITRMLEAHREGGHSATVALSNHTVQIPFGVADVSNGKVVALREKPSSSCQVNAGIYVLNPGILSTIPRGTPFPITTLLDSCINSGLPVGAYAMQEAWSDIGRPEEYERVREWTA